MQQSISERPVSRSNRLSKRTKNLFKRLSLLVIAGLIFMFGLNVGSGRISFMTQTVNQKNLPTKLDYSSVDELYAALRANFDGELDSNKLSEGLKQGLVKATGDPYTVFFNAEDYKAFNNELSGSFTGIGAELSLGNQDEIVVVAPIAGFPAEKAGIKPKDIIAQIDGVSTAGMTVPEAVGKIRGAKDTQVKLKIVRSGQVLDFQIIRQDISIASVDSKIENGIGYLKISRFSEDTLGLAKTAAQNFKSQNVKGVILDLRSDPGGLLDVAVSVSSLWLEPGKTILTERRDSIVVDTYKASGDPILAGVPTSILIDEGSASASEIVAGALKDNGVASLIGQKSYGKGSVQRLVKLGNGAMLKVTIARWFTPNGKNIDKAGITPDQTISISADDLKNGLDPQKAAAIKVLN